MQSEDPSSGSSCRICVGRGVIDITKTEPVTAPGAPWDPDGDPMAGGVFGGREKRIQAEDRARQEFESWSRANPTRHMEVHERRICPACFGLGTDETGSLLLSDAILLWFLTREECPSRPLESFRCQECMEDYPLTKQFFQHIPLSKHQQRQRAAELTSHRFYGTIAEYWYARDPNERVRLLQENRMEVVFYCSDPGCGARFSEYPTYVPPRFPYADAETIRKHPYKVVGGYEFGFKQRDALPGNLCQSCGVGEVLVRFGFVDEQGHAAGTTAETDLCDCGSTFEHVTMADVPKFGFFRDCGDALVVSRNLQLTPLAAAAGVAVIQWTNAGTRTPKRFIGARPKVLPGLEEFLEKIIERHFVYKEVASVQERACLETYEAELRTFRADLVNPALTSNETWRHTYLMAY